jgi:hypothetical protein
VALAASLWLFLVAAVIAPFRLWQDATKRIGELQARLDRRNARLQALKDLGALWEDGTDRVNKIASKKMLIARDAAKLLEMEQDIYRLIEVVSPGGVSTIRVIGNLDLRDHPVHFHPERWDGDNTLIVFRDKLLKVRKFIDKHSPPAMDADRDRNA